MSTTNTTGNSLSKWQIALVVGAPIAFSLGYMYYKNSAKASTKSKTDKPKGISKENGTARGKQISIDGDCQSKAVPTSAAETLLQKAQRYKDKGNEHFKMGKYDEAIAQYNKAIDICPKENTEDRATFYQNRAAAYEHLKKYSAVKEDCTKALELNPKYAKALVRRARALEKTGDLETALEDVTTACIYENFANQTSFVMADRVLTELGKQHAQENLANKKLTLPSKHFIKNYIMSFPNDPVFSKLQQSSLEDISECLKKPLQALKDENYDNIIPLCTEIINSAEFDTLPDKMEILLLRSTFYLLLGEYQAALENLDIIINSDNTYKDIKVNALIKRASLYIQLEKTEQSFNDFELAIIINPNYGDIYHHRGQVNLIIGRIEEAQSDFDKSVCYNKEFSLAHIQKRYADYRSAVSSRNTTLIEKVVKDFEKTFEAFPDHPECYTLYAQIMCEMQKFEKADMYFAKAIEKDPGNAAIYVHRGLLQLQWSGNIDKSVEYINEALELDEKCQLGYETLGSIEVQRGNLEKAITLFNKALELCHTMTELTHIYALRDAAKIQLSLKNKLGSNVFRSVPNMC